MLTEIDPTRGGLRLTIAPEGGGVTVERFAAALRTASDLLEAMEPGSDPVLYGGFVAEGGAVTIEAGPARRAPDAPEGSGFDVPESAYALTCGEAKVGLGSFCPECFANGTVDEDGHPPVLLPSFAADDPRRGLKCGVCGWGCRFSTASALPEGAAP